MLQILRLLRNEKVKVNGTENKIGDFKVLVFFCFGNVHVVGIWGNVRSSQYLKHFSRHFFMGVFALPAPDWFEVELRRLLFELRPIGSLLPAAGAEPTLL